MAKESEKITRVDVRIPNKIYEKINQIAIETNQPVHHRSGKRRCDSKWTKNNAERIIIIIKLL